MFGKIQPRSCEQQVFLATREILDRFTRDELRAYAKSLGVEIGRNKTHTIENLLRSGKALICGSLHKPLVGE